MPSIADILTQNSNDKVEIKSQVNLNGQAFKTFKQFTEEMNIYEQATIVESRNLSSGTSIYGNVTHATYGVSRYNNSYINEFETSRVIPPSRTFTERFVGTSFINGSSTATISGDSATFTAGEYLQSTVIYKNDETISQATLSPVFESGSDNISSYISADTGVTFTQVTNSVLSSIDIPGEEVIYKLVATGNAEITKLEVIIA